MPDVDSDHRPPVRPARAVSPFTVLAQMAVAGPLSPAVEPHDGLGEHQRVLRALLRNLAGCWAARYAALWLDGGRSGTARYDGPAVVWRAGPRTPEVPALEVPAPDPVGDPDHLVTGPGVVATVDVSDGGNRCGVLVLAHRHPVDPRPEAVTLLGATAVCVGLLLRQARNGAAAAQARSSAERAVRRLSTARLELSTVQAVERHRLAIALTATPVRQLHTILAGTDDLERAARDGSTGAGATGAEAIAAAIRSGLGEMIDQFRTVVRGVYPQVLRGSGVRAALTEVAGPLPVPVVFHGDLGRRQGWEIESGLFLAGAATVAALSGSGPGGPVSVELARVGDVLTIRADSAEAEPERVAAMLRDDARRLAALGGRLAVEPYGDSTGVVRPAGTVVHIRLPERLGGERPRPVPAVVEPATVPELAEAPVRHLLQLLVAQRPMDSAPARVAMDRLDGIARVLMVGVAAEHLAPTLLGEERSVGWLPPAAARGGTITYRYRPYRRITVEPAGAGPPWRPVGLADWSEVSWPGVAAHPSRVLVDGPARALRDIRLLHRWGRVSTELGRRLREWSGMPGGPPDAVVLVLGAPPTAAEAEFLSALRAAETGDFTPVTICAVLDGTVLDGVVPDGAVPAPAWRQRLHAMSDTVVGWRPDGGGGSAVEAALRSWFGEWSGALSDRWALRALVACRAAGELDDRFAHAVEAADAGAYQVAELDLVQALRGMRIVLPRGRDAALRLLGASGRDTRSRFGLAGDAGSDEVAAAAARTLEFWRGQAMMPGLSQAGRAVCAQLVAVCERLLITPDPS